MSNVLVLLGAGASVDAGVPASTRMTEEIAKAMSAPAFSRTGIAHALNYAVGALIAHKSARGGNPYDGIDIEQLFSAVQMLGDRESLEIAPFVTWSPVLETIGPPRRIDPFFDKEFDRALLGGSSRRPSDLLAEFVSTMVETDESESVYNRLEQEMLNALTRLLQVKPEALAYLEPLLPTDEPKVRIATLNYDKSIETLAGTLGMDVDTGIAGWQGGHEWKWRDEAQVQLLKLHGSIDWTLTSRVGAGGLKQPAIQINELVEEHATRVNGTTGVVFGARGKVRAAGPFLAMLRELDTMLAAADQLVIVGYSFRDEHINVALTRWINAGVGSSVTVVDPNFLDAARAYSPNQLQVSYPQRLWGALAKKRPGAATSEPRMDLYVIPRYAKHGLPLAFGDKSSYLATNEPRKGTISIHV